VIAFLGFTSGFADCDSSGVNELIMTGCDWKGSSCAFLIVCIILRLLMGENDFLLFVSRVSASYCLEGLCGSRSWLYWAIVVEYL
jgi:hypothetical protein